MISVIKASWNVENISIVFEPMRFHHMLSVALWSLSHKSHNYSRSFACKRLCLSTPCFRLSYTFNDFWKVEFCAGNIIMEIDFLKSQHCFAWKRNGRLLGDWCVISQRNQQNFEPLGCKLQRFWRQKSCMSESIPLSPDAEKFFGTSHCAVPENIHNHPNGGYQKFQGMGI